MTDKPTGLGSRPPSRFGQASPLAQPQAAADSLAEKNISIRTSATLPLTGQAPLPAGTRLVGSAKVLNAINPALVSHRFDEHQFIAFLHNAVPQQSEYAQLNKLTAQNLAEDITDLDTFIDAMFPTEVAGKSGFRLSGELQQAMKMRLVAMPRL